MDRPARSRRSSPTRREVPRRRRLTARCLAAVVIVAALIVGDVGASGPVSAQSGARPTFSDPQLYTDVPPGAEPHRPWSPYWHIQSLARAGVFEGTDCATGRFCPDTSLTRWQMAVWLMRSLGEDDLELDAPGTPNLDAFPPLRESDAGHGNDMDARRQIAKREETQRVRFGETHIRRVSHRKDSRDGTLYRNALFGPNPALKHPLLRGLGDTPRESGRHTQQGSGPPTSRYHAPGAGISRRCSLALANE